MMMMTRKQIGIAIIAILLGVIITITQTTIVVSSALEMTGQQFFPNGTGIAYFDDGSTSRIEHPFTAESGYYYDNSTIFYTGDIPETISGIANTTSTNNNITSCSGSAGGTTPNTSGLLNLFGPDAADEEENNNNMVNNGASGGGGENVNVTIIYGASALDNKSRAFEPNPVRMKVGDTVTWINQDLNLHDLHSPPRVPILPSEGVLSSTTFFGLVSENGGTFSCTFNKPGGFHYADSFDPNMTGTIIVEKK
jgi:plastocyanin